MRLLRTRLIVLASAGFALGAAAPADGGYPPRSVLMFVASWCAPCHGEVARAAEIAAAAAPFEVRVVGFDATVSTEAMLRPLPDALRWEPSAPLRRRIAAELAPVSAGLPFAVAIDRDGRPCASERRGLDAGRVRALVARCLGGAAIPK